MVGKIIYGYDQGGQAQKGEVMLVFTDGLASGLKDYIPLTYLLVQKESGAAVVMRPRDVHTILDKANK